MIELRPYQLDGANWLASRHRAYLADEPRVGKTPQLLLAAAQVGAERIAVYGPASACPVWPKMLERMAVSGYFPLGTPELRFLSYSEVVRSPGRLAEMERWAPGVIVFDEAHRLKSPDAKVTKLLLGSRQHRGVLQDAPFLWAASGTPAPNHPGELYTIFARFWPEAARAHQVASRDQWETMFCEWHMLPGRSHYAPVRVIDGARNEELLRRMLYAEAGGRFLRRTFAEVTGQLEQVEWLEEWVEAEPSQLRQLRANKDVQAVERLLAETPEILPQENEHVMRARRLVGTLKARHVAHRLLESLEDRRQLVVVGWHTDVLDVLERELSKTGVMLVRVDGSTPAGAREQARETFQRGEVRVFLGQLQAIKEGIDLSAADHMALVEWGWSPGDNFQVSRRLMNIEKTRPCTVTAYGLMDTYDERHARLLVSKQRMQEAVHG